MTLLIEEHPLMVLPGLAKAIGLNEAIVLQQIHYWTRENRHVIDGYSWTYNTVEEWQKQFPFWSNATIRRAVDSLVDAGLLLKRKLSQNRFDNTLWYAIDRSKLPRKASNDRIAQNEQIDLLISTDRIAQDEQVRFAQNEQITSTENTKTNPMSGKPDGAEETFDQFWQQYPNKVAKANALKAWRKIKPDASLLAKILKGLSVAKASEGWVKDGGRFVPHPATWLNGKRWEDEAVSGEAPALDGPPPWMKIPEGARWVKGKGIVW